MRILTVGGGGREHAAVEALFRSGAEIYSVMRNVNPGIIGRAKKYKIVDEKRIDDICEFAIEHDINYAFIGPEAPLEVGLVDALENIGVKCAAPTKAAARIETSKAFMRELVSKHNIDGNLKYASFNNASDAEKYIRAQASEIVVKPIGLTGGKGVKVQGEHLHNHEETMAYVREVLSVSSMGGVIIEEKAVGEEFTQMVFVDGKHIAPMPLVQDHKRAYEGDVGPNTGGMGSYSDANHLLPFVPEEARKKSLAILQQIVNAMSAEGCPYVGPMYGQFMLTKNGPKIIEINARFGDPEAMNVLPILETGFFSIIKDMVSGKLKDDIKFKPLATVCKYIVPIGYGTSPQSGHEISVNEKGVSECGAEMFYANVDMVDGKLLTGTSRAIGLVGIGATIEEAEQRCESALKFISGSGICVRHDIGKRSLIQKRVDHMKSL
ncbi:phosphoribosylamine--glycine ligase [Candidatus Methanoplasma termitum]|uniref:Phosphoribosylamine--glycine ligase n=1 Tax=Candidatus Methanoplasma termitum TaxID=1577791 RepID=A0A0A7LDI5_9ARCH|nr:phosphoribosylamine--glycine ligase [Candidatus Methanoplasma termitum]AIZ57235.1 phosphoribosylamine--glycine ligase [Candidatus Methanoplasma termitum]MCL2334328.1 phosphoribosylamine--glycine ligase [Candidatus Methanoplasma sp.]